VVLPSTTPVRSRNFHQREKATLLKKPRMNVRNVVEYVRNWWASWNRK